MVCQCQVCGKLDTFHPELSFHRFPVNPEKRNLWFSIVGFNKDQRLPKHPEICSAHCNPSDIIINQNGLRYVKPGANPEPMDQLFTQSVAYRSDSTTYDTPPKKPGNQKISFDDLVASPGSIASHSDGISLAEKELTSGKEMQPSSVTDTASEAEIEMRKVSAATKKRKRNYIAEMSSRDFSTPQKRRRNLPRVKATVAKQRKIIHSLQMTVRRLRLRITS